MNDSGTIFLSFDLVHTLNHGDPFNIELIKKVLAENPVVLKPIVDALTKIHEEGIEPGCCQNPYRIIYNWVRHDCTDELPKTPENLVGTLVHLRELLAVAFAPKSNVEYYNPDFPAAVRLWSAQKFRIITYSVYFGVMEQKDVMDLAVSGNQIQTVKLEHFDADLLFQKLSGYIPENKDRCFILIAGKRSTSKDLNPWLDRKLKTVIVEDNILRSEPYLERGSSLRIGTLTDFNPELEVQREFY